MKQAVVLIHGIGEQVPMDTLRGFVDAVWTTDTDSHHAFLKAQSWGKPDVASGNYELRRITTTKNREDRRTDFFEFYWAHLMEGTTLSHVGAWAKILIFRRPSQVPPQLRGIWWTLVLLIGLALLVALNQAVKFVPLPAWVIVTATTAWLVLGSTIIGFLIHYAGDAARYLHVGPPNIEIRRQIREAGINLLKNLLDAQVGPENNKTYEYDRIIVVGHSLGSIIGYDILTHLWPRYNDAPPPDGTPIENPALDALEALARNSSTSDWSPTDYQTAQSAYMTELESRKNPWRVTDFITLGSPLAYGRMLLARQEAEFERKERERECPICPPFLEEVDKLTRFSYQPGKYWVPHHAAVFGPTRWTNLYFPCRCTLLGDVVGGPVAPAFGRGVRDVSVQTSIWNGIFSHTFYWTFPKNANEETPDWIKELRKAVRICQTPNPEKPIQPVAAAVTPQGFAR
jgi:hypothetical protein